MDSVFQQADEAFKGAERRPTAQKGGAHAPPKKFTINFTTSFLPDVKLLIIFAQKRI